MHTINPSAIKDIAPGLKFYICMGNNIMRYTVTKVTSSWIYFNGKGPDPLKHDELWETFKGCQIAQIAHVDRWLNFPGNEKMYKTQTRILKLQKEHN